MFDPADRTFGKFRIFVRKNAARDESKIRSIRVVRRGEHEIVDYLNVLLLPQLGNQRSICHAYYQTYTAIWRSNSVDSSSEQAMPIATACSLHTLSTEAACL